MNRKTWKEFKDSKMLWWINRIIHTFGWTIVVEIIEGSEIYTAYPARVEFRGFDERTEMEGFDGITQHLKNNIEELEGETKI